MVGIARFELAAFWSQTRPSTKLTIYPDNTRQYLFFRQVLSHLSYYKIIFIGGARTHDIQLVKKKFAVIVLMKWQEH